MRIMIADWLFDTSQILSNNVTKETKLLLLYKIITSSAAIEKMMSFPFRWKGMRHEEICDAVSGINAHVQIF